MSDEERINEETPIETPAPEETAPEEAISEATAIEEQPDILIQDLEDIPQDPENNAEISTPSNFCSRCNSPLPEGETLCEDCIKKISAYPVSAGAVIGVVLVVLVSLASLFLMGINSMIAKPVLEGDQALKENDLEGCYSAYADSFDTAMWLNNSLVPGAKMTFFTNGTNTLIRQIVALDRLNGPFQAGQYTARYFPNRTPRKLQRIYKDYTDIADFVQAVQGNVSAYRDSLKPEDSPTYDDMIQIVEDTYKTLPGTPDYMVEYYRFSVSYSMADDNARTCEHLDRLQELAPDSLWLYASEGIQAYKLAERYADALKLCNALIKLDASNTATIAYTMSTMRLLNKFDDALAVYDRATQLIEGPSSEMERQYAIILMLQGDTELAQSVLVDSYSDSTATLQHLATIAVCAYINGDNDVYEEYKTKLDTYMPFSDVDAFVEGTKTLEDIFMTAGGEIQ